MAAGVVGGLAAHVGVLDLEAEQGAVGAHAQLVALHALIEEDVARRVGDARGVEHQGAVQHNAVFLGEQRGRTHCYRSASRGRQALSSIPMILMDIHSKDAKIIINAYIKKKIIIIIKLYYTSYDNIGTLLYSYSEYTPVSHIPKNQYMRYVMPFYRTEHCLQLRQTL